MSEGMNPMEMQDWMRPDELDSFTDLAEELEKVKMTFNHWVEYQAKEAVIHGRMTRDQCAVFYRNLDATIVECSHDNITAPD